LYGQRKKLESLFCFFDTDGNGVSDDDDRDDDDICDDNSYYGYANM
jgi:hypothetical protein